MFVRYGWSVMGGLKQEDSMFVRYGWFKNIYPSGYILMNLKFTFPPWLVDLQGYSIAPPTLEPSDGDS